MASQPIQLNTNTYYATIILDACNVTSKTGENILLHQYQMMLQPKEYCYLSSNELDIAAQNAPTKLEAVLEEKLQGGQLFNSNFKFNLFFYENVTGLDAPRMATILAFINGLHTALKVPALQLNTYLVINKDKQNTLQDLQNMDNVVQHVFAGQNSLLPQVILMDVQPLTRPDSAIRATVRMASILSKLNDLSQRMLQMGKQEIWSLTMTEFDKEELGNITAELAQVSAFINSQEVVPADKLNENFNRIKENYRGRSIGGTIVEAKNIPLPKTAVKKCIFGGSEAQIAADKWEQLIRKMFLLNMKNRCFQPFQPEEIRSIGAMFVHNIPLNKWDEALDAFRQRYPDASDQYQPKLTHTKVTAVRSVVKMRKQAEEYVGELNKGIHDFYEKKWLPYQLLEVLPNYMQGTDAKKIRDGYFDRHAELTEQIVQHANIQSCIQYLQQCQNLNQNHAALNFLQASNRYEFMLVSTEVNADWSNEYQAVAPQNVDVYNYQNLQNYEFQLMTIDTFREPEYQRSREKMFKQ